MQKICVWEFHQVLCCTLTSWYSKDALIEGINLSLDNLRWKKKMESPLNTMKDPNQWESKTMYKRSRWHQQHSTVLKKKLPHNGRKGTQRRIDWGVFSLTSKLSTNQVNKEQGCLGYIYSGGRLYHEANYIMRPIYFQDYRRRHTYFLGLYQGIPTHKCPPSLDLTAQHRLVIYLPKVTDGRKARVQMKRVDEGPAGLNHQLIQKKDFIFCSSEVPYFVNFTRNNYQIGNIR